jgi:SAM-dependent methyltransferase
MTDAQRHWEAVYATKPATSVSWYRPVLDRSLALIHTTAPELKTSIVDIGGGASTLVDSLLDAGYTDLTVVDIAPAALAASRARLGERASRVAWLAADLTAWQPPRRWDLWHDRAVFHFLTDAASQAAYIAALHAATHAGSTAIIATFALDGPERCSGLPVQRYSAEGLAARIGAPFVLTAADAERHVTPGGAVQSFVYAVMTRA